MSSTLDICDNDHDTEHDHDNDYIVEQISSDDDDDDVDNDVANGHHDHHNASSPLTVENHYRLARTTSFADDDVHEIQVEEDDVDENRYLLSKSSSCSKYTTPAATSSFAFKSHNMHDIDDNDLLMRNNDGHSSSNSSLNSHSGNSCSNSNQLFLLDTAPSLKLSNLMVSNKSTTKTNVTRQRLSQHFHCCFSSCYCQDIP